jgi:conjugative relaxase-like TrwC/TraI family protein
MLRLFTSRSAYGTKNYFAQSDYYSEGNETVGRWGGKLAARLGLSGPVTEQAFGRLCDNLHPQTGEQLTPRMNKKRRIGEDMMYSLPKSAGITIMLAAPDERDALLKAMTERAKQVQQMIEADVQTRVRRHGAFANRDTGNMCWAGFLHTTSRPVDGKPADPQPHLHLFTFNATEDREEGRIKAIEMANVFRDRNYYEAVFYALMAKEFTERGYGVEHFAGGKWGIAGVPHSACVKLSKRTNEIEEEAWRLNMIDPGRKAELGAKTRAKKQPELSPDALRQAWFDQLTDGERDALAQVHAKTVAPGQEITAGQAVAFALAHLSEDYSMFPERELLRMALLHGLGGVTPEQVAAELERQGVITGELDGRKMATTEALQAEERYLVRIAAGGLGSVCPVGVPEGLTRVRDDGLALNDGQWQTALGLLGSVNRVNLVEGPAGAGKSWMLGKVDEGVKAMGQHVTYLATSTDAVELLAKDGFTVHTVARFLVDERLQRAAAGNRVVVDEVSMLGHKDAVKLFRLVEKHHLKLIFTGDAMQHGSVPRGAFLDVLKDHAGIKPFQLTEIMRQESPEYRAAAGLLSQGKSLEGFTALDRLGWVHELEDDAARVGAMAAEYMQALSERKTCLVIAPTHREAESITQEIRTRLREAGKLSSEERVFDRLVGSNASEAERGMAYIYRPGDVIQFHQNAKGFKKGERLTVGDPAALPLELAGRFSHYRPEKVSLAVGDRLRFTGTVATKDGGTLRNGAYHTVAEFTRGGGIRLDNGKIIAGDAGHFRLGFVDTSFASQGKTVQRVIVGMASQSLPATNMEQLYVSASRGKEKVSIYSDDKEAVTAAIQRSSRKRAALDLQPAPRERDLHQEHLERQRRLLLTRRAPATQESHQRPPERPGPGDRTKGASHAARLLSEPQGRDYGYGR